MAEQLTYEKILELFKETDEQFKETARRFKETEEQFKETDKRFKETDKRIGRITGTLGRFVEGLVEPRLLTLFQQRGIEVTEIHHNVEIWRKGMEEAEIDLLLVNSDYSIAVEIKTTLKVTDIDEHILRLDKLKKNPTRSIKGTKLLGAVAGMRIEAGADTYAYRKGLFVLRQKGEIMEIANDEKFRPYVWEIV